MVPPPSPPPGPPPPLRTTPHACKITSAVHRVHVKIMPYLAIPHGKDREEYTSSSWPTTPPSLLYYMRTRTNDVSAPDRPVPEENIFENRASSFRIGTTPHTHTQTDAKLSRTPPTHTHAHTPRPKFTLPAIQSALLYLLPRGVVILDEPIHRLLNPLLHGRELIIRPQPP